MADPAESLLSRWRRRLDQGLRAGVRRWPLSLLDRVDRHQWQALAACRGLVHQAFCLRPPGPPGEWRLLGRRGVPWHRRSQALLHPRSGAWLSELLGLTTEAIGPWIAYARQIQASEKLLQLRRDLGPTRLVVLVHSWDRVERPPCIDAVAHEVRDGGYCSVIRLRHWKDPKIEVLPPEWVLACNGYRSNPSFLDCLLTLLELSDGLASNSFGTHLGYVVALERRLRWIGVAAEKAVEWAERERLSGELQAPLRRDSNAATTGVRDLFTPYWGLDCRRRPEELRRLLTLT